MIATGQVSEVPHIKLGSQIHTTDTQADPLLLACLAGSVDGHTNLLVTLVEILNDFLALLFNLGDGSFLLNDEGVHILEQLSQLNHLLLDLDESLVTVLNSAQGSTGTTLAIALHHGLAKDLTSSSVLDSSLNLLLRGIWAHNAVLAGHLILCAFSELRLDLLVLGDGSLETAVNAGDVRVVLWRFRLRVRLDGADSLGELTVERHGISGK